MSKTLLDGWGIATGNLRPKARTAKRRTLQAKQRPKPSGRVGRDVVVLLHRAELHFLQAAIDALAKAWPATVPMPAPVETLPRMFRKKVIRRGGGDDVAVRLPKSQARALGGALLQAVEFMRPEALRGAGGKHFMQGTVKLLYAGTSRPGKRAELRDIGLNGIEETTLQRRRNRAKNSLASKILLGE